MHKAILRHTAALPAVISLGAAALAAPVAAQSIAFSEGAADITFFYSSANNSWDVVFREKGNTVATGLTTPYGTPPGGVGGSTGDHNFTELNVLVSDAPAISVNGISYFVTPAADTTYNTDTQPDLGFRTRLKEVDNGNEVDQFDNLRATLNPTESTMPTDAEFILFRAGNPLEGEPETIILYETNAGDLVHDWPAWGHTHWHWGFSEQGEYSLLFDFQGIGGLHGPSSTDSVRVNFSVIPEPGTFAAAFGLVALGIVFFRRRRGQES
ncbi:MAG: hypothetical protein JJU00_03995 [Opitutales bacterium]|nr:hypothetical protein [Opitutales bacterium]